MRVRRLVMVAGVVSTGWMAGCTGIAGTPDAGTTAPDASTGPGGFTFDEAENVGPDDPSRSGGLALARNGDEISVLYYVDRTTTRACMTNFDTKQVAESELKLARAPNRDDGFTVTSVAVERSAEGVDAVYSPTGELTAVYAGGENGSGSCAASDLVQAVIPASGMPTVTTLAADGNTSATCNVIQNACNRGDVIGRFSRIAFTAAGARVVASMDTHFGFSTQTDFEGSDLEVHVGGGLETVDNSSGAGNFNVLMVARDDQPAVAYVQIKEHEFVSGMLQRKGIWVAQRQMDGTWVRNHVTERLPTNQVGAAWHPTLGYAVAYQDPAERDLRVATSVDGMTWTDEGVDVLGDVGRDASAAFSGDRLVVVYGACSGPTDTIGNCVPARDGVKMAWREGATGQWNISRIHNTEEFLEGTDIRMVMDAQGNPTVAFKSQGTRRVMVMRGRRR